jgi:nucleotide-binding universal stress UspA family protein
VKKLENILVYFDGEPDIAVLDRAVEVARAHGARVLVVDVVKPARSHFLLAKSGFDFDGIECQLVEERKAALDAVVARIVERDVPISTRVEVGNPVSCIVDMVREESFDLLIKPSAVGEGVRRPLFGCTDKALMRLCRCPVAIGRPKARKHVRRVVAALACDQGDPWKQRLNRWILDSALLLRQEDHEELYLLHAWALYGESLLAHGKGKVPPKQLQAALELEQTKRREWLEKLVQDYRSTLDEERGVHFDPELELLRGDPAVVIPRRVAELDADLIAIGTASRAGLAGLVIGNTAEVIVDRVDCTVVVHKPEEFAS